MEWARGFEREAKNDKREFDALVQRTHRHAFNVAYRLAGNHADAEDITQEAFVRAYRFFDRYDRHMPFENWLYRIISNVFIDEMRRRPKIKPHSLDQPLPGASGDSDIRLDLPAPKADPEGIMMEGELEESLQLALNSLPIDFRNAVILADVQGLSYEEIASVMGCSLGTVRSRLHRGRKSMRNKLTGVAGGRKA